MLRCIEIKLTKSLRQKKNIKNNKRKATNNIQGNSQEVISWILSRNSAGQEYSMMWSQWYKEEPTTKPSLRFDREIKSFTNKQKLKIQQDQTSFTTNAKGMALGWKKKSTHLEARKLPTQKLTRKGKHTLKVGNQPRTDMISKPATLRRGGYKCRISEVQLKLKEQQLKTMLFIYGPLYQIFMVTANWKSTINTHKTKRNPNIKGKLVVKSQEKRLKEEGGKNDLQKNLK